MKIIKHSKNALIYDEIRKYSRHNLLNFNEFNNYMNALSSEGIKTFYIARGRNSGNIVLFCDETTGFYVSHNDEFPMQMGINDGFARLHGGVWEIVEEINF